MLEKDIPVRDPCSGILTQILYPVLEILLKMENIKAGTFLTGPIWKCPTPGPSHSLHLSHSLSKYTDTQSFTNWLRFISHDERKKCKYTNRTTLILVFFFAKPKESDDICAYRHMTQVCLDGYRGGGGGTSVCGHTGTCRLSGSTF